MDELDLNYRGYSYRYTEDNCVVLQLNTEKSVQFESEEELFDYVDMLRLKRSTPRDPKEFYIFRIHKQDVDSFGNYMYYTSNPRRRFVYGQQHALRMTKDQAEFILKNFPKDPNYHYSIGR